MEIIRNEYNTSQPSKVLASDRDVLMGKCATEWCIIFNSVPPSTPVVPMETLLIIISVCDISLSRKMYLADEQTMLLVSLLSTRSHTLSYTCCG